MWIRVEHDLVFQYSDPIQDSRVEIRVEPRNQRRQALHSFTLAVGPPTRVNRYTDCNGNSVHHFGISDFHDRIEVRAQSLVETQPDDTDLASLEARPSERTALGPLLEWLTFDDLIVDSPRLDALCADLSSDPTAPIGEQILDTGAMIRDRLKYVTGATEYTSDTDDVIAGGEGVCQDFAHVQIAMLRRRGVPARYVSGYLHLGTGEDAESHAWIEVHAGERGWIGYDPTHSRVPDEQYVCVGWGRNYDDVAPNRGVFRGSADETLSAIVRTAQSEPQAVADLHQAFAQIRLPVVREAAQPFDRSHHDGRTQRQQQQQQVLP